MSFWVIIVPESEFEADSGYEQTAFKLGKLFRNSLSDKDGRIAGMQLDSIGASNRGPCVSMTVSDEERQSFESDMPRFNSSSNEPVERYFIVKIAEL